MTVVVAYKFAANPQDALVGADGVVDWSRAKVAVSEYDPVAVALARQLADAQGSEVVGVSVGTSAVASSAAKKAAMSRGADRGIVLADDATESWNATQVAAALAALVRRVEGAQILITGDSSVDEGNRMMGSLVAGYLGWPCFQDVCGVEKTASGYAITQVIAGGTRRIEVEGSVVVSASSDALEVKPPSMKEILAAGKKPVEEVAVADIELPQVGASVTARRKPAAVDRKHQIFAGDDAAAQLVAALRAEGVL